MRVRSEIEARKATNDECRVDTNEEFLATYSPAKDTKTFDYELSFNIIKLLDNFNDLNRGLWKF